MSNNLIEIFGSEEEAMGRIEQLLDDGYSEADMYLIAKTDGQLSMVNGRTNVDTQAAEGNRVDRFTTFLTGDKKVRKAFKSMGIDGDTSEEYYRKIQNGKLLLYVNDNYAETPDSESEDSFQLGEKEKTELQNKKLDDADQSEVRIENEEETVKLDERQYNETALRQGERKADPAAKRDDENFN